MKNFILSIKNNKENRVRLWTVTALVLIALLAAFLRFYQLGVNGTNEYYAAAVKSMLTSWHNFFFVSYEPGGSVSVDKPPLGFWIEALSALIFGVNNFSLALPNAAAGVISVLLLFTLVKKPFGRKAALIAALALACMPITVAAERNNTIDGMLVCVLLLAAWVFFRSVETRKPGYLFMGAVFIGLAFNIKMLQAFMVLPALFLFYLIGARYKWGQRLLHLTGALVLLLAVSLSWTLIVDAVPASERPYIGSSTNNTVWELVIGHNGLERFESLRQSFSDAAQGAPRLANNNGTGPGPMGNPPGNTQGTSGGQSNGLPGSPAGGPGGPVPRSNPNGQIEQGGQAPLPRSGDSGWMQPGNAMDGGSGMNGTGTAGILRLFQDPLAAQVSWLLPAVLIGLVLFVGIQRRLGASTDQKLSAIFWAAWLLPMMAYFSFTQGLWHSYYLIMLGPGIAALFGITFWLLDHLRSWSLLFTGSLITVLSAVVIGFQIYAIYTYHYFANFFAVLLGALWLISILLYWIKPRSATLAAVFMAMIIAPLLWSALTTLNPNAAANLPQADPIANPAEIGRKRETASSSLAQQEVIDYLQTNTKANKYLLATLSAREASPFILATSLPVLTFGGYTGSDNIIDASKLAEMVNSGELRFVLDKGDLLQKKTIYEWVQKNCSIVQTLNSIDSSSPNGGNPLSEMETRLYDCAQSPN